MNDRTSERDVRIDQAVLEYLEAERVGRPLTIVNWLARHPDLQKDLEGFLVDRSRFARAADMVAATSVSEPKPGELPAVRFFGDYELLDEVGRGGMGVVYRARQVSLGRSVALKMILRGALATPADRYRFRVEAEAAGGLDHPNIVPIYDVGEHDDHPYYTMKFVGGGTLSKLPREDAKSEVGRLATVAHAVHFAHQRGILHRDLKPSNILLESNPQNGRLNCFVADFGLAKRLDADRTFTESGVQIGTPRYMAPEQAEGKRDLSVTADVYSLGVVLYERLTGRPPYLAETVFELLRMLRDHEPTSPRLIDKRISRDLEKVVMKCLQRTPEARYQSAGELADDLDRWSRGESVTARPLASTHRLWRWCERNRHHLKWTAATAAMLGGTIAVTAHLAQEAKSRYRMYRDAERDLRAAETLSKAIEKQRDEIYATMSGEMGELKREFQSNREYTWRVMDERKALQFVNQVGSATSRTKANEVAQSVRSFTWDRNAVKQLDAVLEAILKAPVQNFHSMESFVQIAVGPDDWRRFHSTFIADFHRRPAVALELKATAFLMSICLGSVELEDSLETLKWLSLNPQYTDFFTSVTPETLSPNQINNLGPAALQLLTATDNPVAKDWAFQIVRRQSPANTHDAFQLISRQLPELKKTENIVTALTQLKQLANESAILIHSSEPPLVQPIAFQQSTASPSPIDWRPSELYELASAIQKVQFGQIDLMADCLNALTVRLEPTLANVNVENLLRTVDASKLLRASTNDARRTYFNQNELNYYLLAALSHRASGPVALKAATCFVDLIDFTGNSQELRVVALGLKFTGEHLDEKTADRAAQSLKKFLNDKSSDWNQWLACQALEVVCHRLSPQVGGEMAHELWSLVVKTNSSWLTDSVCRSIADMASHLTETSRAKIAEQLMDYAAKHSVFHSSKDLCLAIVELSRGMASASVKQCLQLYFRSSSMPAFNWSPETTQMLEALVGRLNESHAREIIDEFKRGTVPYSESLIFQVVLWIDDESLTDAVIEEVFRRSSSPESVIAANSELFKKLAVKMTPAVAQACLEFALKRRAGLSLVPWVFDLQPCMDALAERIEQSTAGSMVDKVIGRSERDNENIHTAYRYALCAIVDRLDATTATHRAGTIAKLALQQTGNLHWDSTWHTIMRLTDKLPAAMAAEIRTDAANKLLDQMQSDANDFDIAILDVEGIRPAILKAMVEGRLRGPELASVHFERIQIHSGLAYQPKKTLTAGLLSVIDDRNLLHQCLMHPCSVGETQRLLLRRVEQTQLSRSSPAGDGAVSFSMVSIVNPDMASLVSAIHGVAAKQHPAFRSIWDYVAWTETGAIREWWSPAVPPLPDTFPPVMPPPPQ